MLQIRLKIISVPSIFTFYNLNALQGMYINVLSIAFMFHAEIHIDVPAK